MTTQSNNPRLGVFLAVAITTLLASRVIELSFLALMLLSLAAYVVYKQRHAKSCPAHSRTAGQVAIILAVFSAVAGAGLLVFVWAWS